MKRIELHHSTIIYREDGIIELDAHDDHVYCIQVVIENVESFGQLTSFQKVPVLISDGSFSSLDKET
jgi:hypothetical protein